MSVRFAADIASFERNVTKAERTFLASAKSMTKMGEELTLKLTAPFLLLTGVMAKAAADAEAQTARFARMFGPAADQMEAFGKQMMKVIPVTDEEMKGLLATTQQFISQLGLAPQAALAMTKSVTQLAGDIAAFRNIDITQVMMALEHGMAGRTQGLITLGIAINKVEVNERAYRMGLARTGEKLTVAQQSEATLAIVREKTANITGQAAAMAGNAANATKFLHQATVELAEQWGETLLPKLVTLVHGLTDIARAMSGADESTKLFAFGLGGLVAVIGPLLIVSGSLIRALTDIARLGRLIAGAEGLMALAAGGAVVVAVVAGLGLIGYWLYKSGEDARNAAAAIDDYKSSLIGLSQIQLAAQVVSASSNVEFLKANLQAAKDAHPATRVESRMHPGTFSVIEDPSVRSAQLQYDTAKNALRVAVDAFRNSRQIAGLKVPPKQPPGGKVPKDFEFAATSANMARFGAELDAAWARIARQMNLSIGDATANAATLTSAFGASTDKLKLFPFFMDQANALAAKAYDTIKHFPNPLSDANIEAQKLLNTLEPIMTYGALTARFKLFGYNNADPTDVFNKYGGFGASGTGAGGIGDASKTFTPIVGKLNDLGGIFKDAIASQAQFIAQSLTTVLGVRNANAGGAIGSVLGGGIAGAIGKSLFTSAAGAAIGGTLGSIVPVVGTVIGSLAGGFLGNAIGKLFGGGGAANNSTAALNSLATAAQKVTAALSNVPTGFKIALERYRLSDPSAIPFGASLPAGYGPAGGVTFNGPVTVVTQAQTADQLYRDLTTRARRDGLRGGATQWQLAGASP